MPAQVCPHPKQHQRARPSDDGFRALKPSRLQPDNYYQAQPDPQKGLLYKGRTLFANPFSWPGCIPYQQISPRHCQPPDSTQRYRISFIKEIQGEALNVENGRRIFNKDKGSGARSVELRWQRAYPVAPVNECRPGLQSDILDLMSGMVSGLVTSHILLSLSVAVTFS